MPAKRRSSRKSKADVDEAPVVQDEAVETGNAGGDEETPANVVEESTSTAKGQDQGVDSTLGDEDAEEENGTEGLSSVLTMKERMEKLQQLRLRKNEASNLNRKAVISAKHAPEATAGRLAARLVRKQGKAEAMAEKQEAEETGEDLERKRNWAYSIEDSDAWEKKQDRKKRRADQGFTDYDDMARRKYKKDIDALKPDMTSYRAQRELAHSTSIAEQPSSNKEDYDEEGNLIPAGSSSGELSRSRAEEILYRDANSFVYADHKPNDDAIDRVVSYINDNVDKRYKRSRIRKEDEGDITYINERNKHFNKKISRFYDKYTQEIRDNFERGTAL